MFRDPGIDLKTKPIMEQMRQMTANQSASQIAKNRKVEINYCPFLTLPDQLITRIFSLLRTKDRLRARVNKRLKGIVLPHDLIMARMYSKFRDRSRDLNYRRDIPMINLTTEPIIEQMRQMALCRQTKINCELDKDYGDFCPILTLPNELISDIFSLLSKKDRLRARANKRLNGIEVEFGDYVEMLSIAGHDERFSDYLHLEMKNPLHTFFFKEKSDAFYSIRRMSQNSSFGHIVIKNDFVLKGVLVDSLFLDISKKCKYLYVYDFDNMTAETLHQVYKNMIDGSTNLRILDTDNIKRDTCIELLKLIGINCLGDWGNFSSNRDVEVFKHLYTDGNTYTYLFFDGNIEIILDARMFSSYEKTYAEYGNFAMDFHENGEERIKKLRNNEGFMRVSLSH